jgi:hypothetical protein
MCINLSKLFPAMQRQDPSIKSHGLKRRPNELKEICTAWKACKKEKEQQRKLEMGRQRAAQAQAYPALNQNSSDNQAPPGYPQQSGRAQVTCTAKGPSEPFAWAERWPGYQWYYGFRGSNNSRSHDVHDCGNSANLTHILPHYS